MKNYLNLILFVFFSIAANANYLPYAEPYMAEGSSAWIYPNGSEPMDKDVAIAFYSPAASANPTTAIPYESPRFVEWASGWKDVVYGKNCAEEWRTPHLACGKAGTSVFDVVCLGDGGRITMTFDNPIRDGDGFDFAVFENSFDEKFLELAYVEVSSDGVNFVRFPNMFLGIAGFEDFQYGDPPPVGPSGSESCDARLIYNLGSKYSIGNGHPFDLSELARAYAFAKSANNTFSVEYTKSIIENYPKLDLQNIRYVRIIDIIGDGQCLDSEGWPIFDPCNCVGSAGFDLDAIGVINSARAPDLKAQTITFEELSPVQYNKVVPIQLSATSDSGLAVRFEIVSGDAALEGNILTPAAVVGTILIRAVQDGNSVYAKATAYQTLSVTAKQTQTITFTAIPNRKPTDGNTVPISARSSSGLAVGFYLVDGNGIFNGGNLVLNSVAAPQLIKVRAYQDGNDDYAAAVPVDRTFAICNSKSYAAWAAENSISASDIDPNSDGFCAAFDYVFNTSPSSANAAGIPIAILENGTITTTWRVCIDSSDMTSLSLRVKTGSGSSWLKKTPALVRTYIEGGKAYSDYKYTTTQAQNDVALRFEVALTTGATGTSKEFAFAYKYDYAQWIIDNKIGAADSAFDKCMAGDGMTNLQKYASNLDARAFCTQSQVARHSVAAGVATFTYTFYKFADVQKTFQWSGDLVNWNDVDESQVSQTESGTNLIMEFSKSVTPSNPLFMRVKIAK